MDRIRKKICKLVCQLGLTTTISTRLKEVSFLDIKLNFSRGQLKPWHKSDKEASYKDKGYSSPAIIKELVYNISSRVSQLFADKVTLKRLPYTILLH